MKEKNSFLKKLKKIVFKVKGNKKLNLKKINFSEDFDSLEMLNFVDIIEKSFKIKIGPKELNYKNFSNLANLQKMIEKK
tara:strand:- start:876 stop:1112 length:237 start_codon:yes stop_codon:yes gene_type:complete